MTIQNQKTMTQDEHIQQLKEAHDKLQEGLPSHQMAIRDGIVVDVGEGAYDSYPRFGFQHFCWRNPICVQELDLFIKYAKGKKCLLDCGAFHGIFSLVFNEINKDGVAYAFEPFSEAYQTLVKYSGDRLGTFHVG